MFFTQSCANTQNWLQHLPQDNSKTPWANQYIPFPLLWHYFRYLLYYSTHYKENICIFLTIYQHYFPPNRVLSSIHGCFILEILHCWHSPLVLWILSNKIPIQWWNHIKFTFSPATVPLRNLFFWLVCSNLKNYSHQFLPPTSSLLWTNFGCSHQLQAYAGTEKLFNFMYTN